MAHINIVTHLLPLFVVLLSIHTGALTIINPQEPSSKETTIDLDILFLLECRPRRSISSFVVRLFLLLTCPKARDPVSISQEEIANLATIADTHTEHPHPLPDLRIYPLARQQEGGVLGVKTPSTRQQGGGETLHRGGVDVEIHLALTSLMNLKQRIENGVAASVEKEFRQNSTLHKWRLSCKMR